MKNEKQDFIPHHCPNAECRFHHKQESDKKWFVRYSTCFSRKENRQVQRFMCLGCNKTFSERTFASDYCLKLDLRYDRLFASMRKGMSLAGWSEALGHSVSVIENRLKRLGRWLVTHGYITAGRLSRLRDCGLVRFGLIFKGLWLRASHPEHHDMRRCYLKQLEDTNIVDAEEIWTLLSWSYWLGYDYYYRPAFTYY